MPNIRKEIPKDLKRLWREQQARMKLEAEDLDPSQTWQVAASTDDCEVWDGSDNVHPPWEALFMLDTGNPWVGKTTGAWWGTGHRFLNVTIPKGAIIQSAYLKVCAISPSAAMANLLSMIQGQLGDADTFSTTADYNARSRTLAKVEWDGIGAWAQDLWYDSPNIKTVIQEIINDVGWASGNDLVIFFEDDGTLVDNQWKEMYSWDGDHTRGSKLEVTWTLPLPKGTIAIHAKLLNII
jgi:hypothetical protein